jgi:cytochrome c oxidase subunit III
MTTVVSRPQAAVEEHQPSTRSMGWYGMVFFIGSEAVFFANLIAAYLYLYVRDGKSFNPPGPGHVELDTRLALINTVILLSSSIPMHFAARAIARGDRQRFPWLLLCTIILGSIFIGIQLYEYVNNGFGPSTGVIGSTFYTLTGFHGAHVTAGLVFLTVLFFRGLRGDFSKDKHFAVTAGEMYWHFVDVVWVFLMSLVYLLPLVVGY